MSHANRKRLGVRKKIIKTPKRASMKSPDKLIFTEEKVLYEICLFIVCTYHIVIDIHDKSYHLRLDFSTPIVGHVVVGPSIEY